MNRTTHLFFFNLFISVSGGSVSGGSVSRGSVSGGSVSRVLEVTTCRESVCFGAQAVTPRGRLDFKQES